ncbi:tail tape measure protein [uncultured Duncaniella sp.]|uniref:tail tape measure protein n=1 Tax=uncultured Duncaniella sp. TaxID=2768039 RepID=UPI0026766028|nr:tail tape measure protein [uncultured Duncaniella sp.]
MKPVELEIFLQDGLTPGLKKAGQTVSHFTNDTKRQLKDVAGALTVQRGIVRDLEKQYRDLEKSVKKMAPGQATAKASSQLAALKKELDAEKAGLEELTKQQRELKLEADNAGASLRQQLRSVREEIATLLLAYRSLTDQEKQSAQGKELARHIDELTEKAGELNDAIADTSQAIINAASDSRGFDQLAGGIQLVVDGFGLATAGAQALGLSESDLMEVQTQLQTALVASNALTSMQVNLQKQSALMQGVNVIQTKAAATAETIRTWAVGRGTIATKAATIAQAAFNAVAKANPYVLLAMAVVTVVGALYALAKGNEAAKKAEEERQAQLERTKVINEGIARSIGESAGSQIAAYNKLQRAWKALGDDMAKRRKFVDENKKAFQELGLSVNSVKDAEEVLVNNTSNVVQSFILRAKAAALDKAVTQAYSTMLERQDLARRNARYTVKSQGDEVSYADAQARGMAGVRAVPHEHVRANGGGATMSSWTTYTYEVSDAGAYNAASNRLAIEARDREIQAATAEADRRVNDLQKEIGATEDALDALKIPQMIGGTTPTDTTVNPTKEDRLEAARKEAEKLQKLRWQNEQDEINQMADGAERRRRQIALDYEKELAEIEAQMASFKALNKESSTTGLNADGLTETQQTEIDRAGRIVLENRDKAMQEVYQLELQHIEEYLKEYGTFQQKKLAMSEEYDRKIAEASDEWVKKSLEKEKATSLQNIEIDAIKQSVDWGSVFSGFGTMFRDQLEPTIAKLRAISETEEFRNSDLQDQQTLYELIAKLEDANTSWDSGIFVTLGNDLTAYQTAMRNYMDAQDRERLATEALTAAKRKLAQAEQSGNADAITAAKAEVATATTNMNEASDRVRSFGADVQEASNSLQASTTRVNNMFNTLVSSLAGLKSGSLQSVGESLMSLDKLFNNSGITNAVGGALAKGMSKLLGNSAIGKSVSEALGNSGLIGQIISAVLSLLDILKDGIGVLVSSLIDTVLNAISGILKNLLNGKMFVQIGQSLIDGIAGIFDAITFGGFTSWFSSSNAKEVQETIDKLTERNELLQTAIEDLTDEIKASKGTKSVAAYRDAYRNQQEVNNNYLGIAQAQAGYHGSHHSWNYYFDGFSQEQIARLSRQIGRSWDGNIWSLLPEEMKMLRANVDMWKQIQDTGKGGYGGRLTEKLNDYIAQAGKLKELTNELYEGLTGISFDSMYDSFIDQLMDMSSSAEDIIDNLSEYFMRAMLSNKIGELYADKLEEWWKKFGKAMEDNDLTEAERNALSEEYMKYVEEAMKLRDQLAAATGYGSEDKGSSQSGKAGSFNAMSQDQGTKLEGLFVSAQIHLANIDTIVENVAERMSAAEGYLAQIAENTKSNAASAEEIKELLVKIARDGIRTK